MVAVGSRSQERGRAFGERFGIPHRHDSYVELVKNPHVQAVYIATPASAHKANIELCLQAGKAVLCEKPLTVNMREAQEVIALARRNRVFLMEAMWTRFVPLIVRLRELLAERVVGDIRHVMADLGSQVMLDPGSRVYSEELGGGALLQKGVYLLSLASMILGSPTSREKFIGSREDRGRRGHQRTVGVPRVDAWPCCGVRWVCAAGVEVSLSARKVRSSFMIRLSALRVFLSGCMGPGSDITLPSRRKQRPVSRHEFYAMPRAAD